MKRSAAHFCLLPLLMEVQLTQWNKAEVETIFKRGQRSLTEGHFFVLVDKKATEEYVNGKDFLFIILRQQYTFLKAFLFFFYYTETTIHFSESFSQEDDIW